MYTRSGQQTLGQQGESSSSQMSMQSSSDSWKLKVFLLKLAKEINEEELDSMKFLMKGECGMGKRTLSEIKTVTQFFNHMMEIDFVNRFNLLQLQSILWHLGRKDLHVQLVSFARDYRAGPLHFFIPNPEPRNGYKYADFHIGGDLETTSVQDLENLRTNISERLDVPAKFIFIKGIQPLHSLIVTLMVPAMAVFALFELSDIEKSMLQSLRIDSFEVGDKRVQLGNLKFEKAATLSEKEEIKRILENKELLTSELDKSHARLIERSNALSSSEEELAQVKVTTDQLKMANDRAMMILATLVYQDLAHNSSPTDSLCRLSILTYFKFCLKQFQLQYPEAAKHIGDLLDANTLVVRKTERDLHKNYVERLQIHQLALEHCCQTVQPAYTLSDHLFQRPSESVRQQYVNTKGQHQISRPSTLTPDNQNQSAPPRKKLFDRRAEEKKTGPHPFSSALKEISLKLKVSHKEKLLGNLRFNKVEEMEIAKQPEKFLHLLFEKELGEIPADPCDHVLKKLRITEDQDLHSSAGKLLKKRRSDLKVVAGNSSTSGHKKISGDFSKSVYRSKTPVKRLDLPSDADQSPHGTHGVHKSASESALKRHDSGDDTHEKLDRLLSEIENIKLMMEQKQPVYLSPDRAGVRQLMFPGMSPTDYGSMPRF